MLLRVGASQAEVERWDARLNEKRVILGGRDRLGGDYVVFAERSFERRSETLRQCRIVVDGISALGMFDQRFFRRSGGERFGFCGAGNGWQGVFAHVSLVTSHGKAKLRLVGD